VRRIYRFLVQARYETRDNMRKSSTGVPYQRSATTEKWVGQQDKQITRHCDSLTEKLRLCYEGNTENNAAPVRLYMQTEWQENESFPFSVRVNPIQRFPTFRHGKHALAKAKERHAHNSRHG